MDIITAAITALVCAQDITMTAHETVACVNERVPHVVAPFTWPKNFDCTTDWECIKETEAWILFWASTEQLQDIDLVLVPE